MRRRHEMKFGASVEADGRVTFALWAPAARQVDLRLLAAGNERTLAMARQDDGRFVLATGEAKATQIRRALEGDANPTVYPVHTVAHATWLLDEAAASLRSRD